MTDLLRPTRETSDSTPSRGSATWLFGQIEHAIAVGIGLLLCLAAILALTGAVTLAWDAVLQWPHIRSLFGIVDRLLFVLMIVEILHTVRASIQSHRLASEPFLIVGLIATIRRILVVTLEISDNPAERQAILSFDHAMIELCVLAALTLVLAVSIHLLHRSKADQHRP